MRAVPHLSLRPPSAPLRNAKARTSSTAGSQSAICIVHLCRYFAESGFEHVVLLSADGALEAAPAMGAADIILDLVSTGVTLRENNLKELRGGDILEARSVRACVRVRASGHPLAPASPALSLSARQCRTASAMSLDLKCV
jgi:ATP phosphoribosyltransferase